MAHKLRNFSKIFDITGIFVEQMKARTQKSHLNMYSLGGYPGFGSHLTLTLKKSRAEIENGVAYKKKCEIKDYVTLG